MRHLNELKTNSENLDVSSLVKVRRGGGMGRDGWGKGTE